MFNADFPEETWKRLTFEGIRPSEQYEVSDHGRIRWWNKETGEWELCKQYVGNNFQYVGFRMAAKGRKNRALKAVHRLVAEHFCERPSDKHQFVIHQNYELSDNHASNLHWVTRHELTLHNRANPKVQAALHRIKGKVTNSKLTETQVMRLKMKLKRSNNPLYKIAKEFGITHTQLNRIRKGENWGHIDVD